MSRPAFDVAAIRAAEAAVIAEVGDLALMRRAAHGLALTCVRLLGGVYGSRVALVVGTGNNGGDALFAGAELAGRGADVTAVQLGGSCHEAGRRALLAAGGRVVPADARAAEWCVESADLVLDAVVGIGGRGALASRPADLFDLAASSGAVVVAVDLPSGVDADTGIVAGDAVCADVTVTFGARKLGLTVAPGAQYCGLVEVVDIGLGDALRLQPPAALVLDADDVAALLPRPTPTADKYSQGVPGIAAGSPRYPGAAVLATGAALHAKAGLVRYVGNDTVAQSVVRRWPSAIVHAGSVTDAGQVQAWGIGPGIGTDDVAQTALRDVLASDRPVVVDADALTMLSRHDDLVQLVRTRTAPTVLTPHDGEFARLAPDLDLSAGRLTAATELAQRWSATVLLKGVTTVVVTPGQVPLVNPTGSVWLANAGSGDVLTGLLTAYLAAGLDAHLAAGAAAFVHGLAGHLASGGDTEPITSEDVIGALAPAYAAISGDSSA
jgi:hydroxyethylthiazole kinase-like uncharacterized protein yjeF